MYGAVYVMYGISAIILHPNYLGIMLSTNWYTDHSYQILQIACQCNAQLASHSAAQCSLSGMEGERGSSYWPWCYRPLSMQREQVKICQVNYQCTHVIAFAFYWTTDNVCDIHILCCKMMLSDFTVTRVHVIVKVNT